MNTDYEIQNQKIRDEIFEQNITSSGNSRYYDDGCKTIRKYAKEQNTIYDPLTNQMLYGINSQMKAFGVSDGTCDQINPLIYTPLYKCGAGAAGGNRCWKIENFTSGKNDSNKWLIVLILCVLLFVVLHKSNN